MDSPNWQEKYDKLMQDYKDLDAHNDVLYRCYHLAKYIRDNPLTPELAERFKQAIADVESFENELSNRKQEHRPS